MADTDKVEIGGAEGDRTPDLRIANATLSQLSYGPTPSTAPRRLRAGSGRADNVFGPMPCQGMRRVECHLISARISAEKEDLTPLRQASPAARVAAQIDAGRKQAMHALIFLLDRLLGLYELVLVVWVVLSWLISFNVVNTQNRFVYVLSDILYRLTEPALRPIRRILPNLGGLDISPIILILIIYFIRDFLVFDLLRYLG